MQASILVADLASKPGLDETELHETIMARNRLHLLLILGHDLEADGTEKEMKDRLFAVFLGPPDKEMWRRDRERTVGYVWRSSAVQLQPTIAITNNGAMGAHVDSGLLKLQSYRALAEDPSTSINIDMRKKLVDVAGLANQQVNSNESTEKITLRMKLIDLKCYRQPGEVRTVTRGP
jgi:hypothetical protein